MLYAIYSYIIPLEVEGMCPAWAMIEGVTSTQKEGQVGPDTIAWKQHTPKTRTAPQKMLSRKERATQRLDSWPFMCLLKVERPHVWLSRKCQSELLSSADILSIRVLFGKPVSWPINTSQKGDTHLVNVTFGSFLQNKNGSAILRFTGL